MIYHIPPGRTAHDDLPSRSELAEDERARTARDPGHNFVLPCGPEDFDPRPSWRSPAANQEPTTECGNCGEADPFICECPV